jgi:hypothetical protein
MARLLAPAALGSAAAVLALAALLGPDRSARAQEAPRRATVEDMDMALLQRSLLKIYVCGKESTLHDAAMDKLRLATQHYGDPAHPKVISPTAEEVKEAELRNKYIFNYLLTEKVNAVQMVHIIDRILGTDVHLAGEGRAERKILERKVELIEVPRGTDMPTAGRMISEALGCPVKVETLDTEINRIWFTLGPTDGETIVKQVCASAPYDWRIENGVLIFRHRKLSGTGPAAAPSKDDDDEDKKPIK